MNKEQECMGYEGVKAIALFFFRPYLPSPQSAFDILFR